MAKALAGNPIIDAFFVDLFVTVHFPVWLILLGMVFTVIIHSSGAATAIFMALAANGLVDIQHAMFLVLGANIGTSNTAFFAAMPAGVEAKRAALANLFMNIIGVAGFTLIIWPFRYVFAAAYESIIPDPVWQISLFNIAYNVVKSVPLLYLIEPVNRLACALIREKPKPEKKLKTQYINDSLLDSPAAAMVSVKKEILDMARIARESLTLAFKALLAQDLSGKKRIKKQEELINFLYKSISTFVVNISELELSEEDSQFLGGFHHAANDIERIGDYAKKMLQEAGRMKKHNCTFSKKSAVKGLTGMFDTVSIMFELSLALFESGSNKESGEDALKELHALDREIDKMKMRLADSHVQWIQSAHYHTVGGDYFYSNICDLERVADHLVNFALSVHLSSPRVTAGEESVPSGYTRSVTQDNAPDTTQ
jgi:phosphate:Na+ symporter